MRAGRQGSGEISSACYLTDEWGCPSGEPIIGIRFIWRTRRWRNWKKKRMTSKTRENHDVPAPRSGARVHLCVQAACQPEWKQMFGPFRRPYRDNYAAPFSRDYVRHLRDVCEKHPDEICRDVRGVADARSNWRKRYRGWGAMQVAILERLARKLGKSDPPRRRGQTDVTVDEWKRRWPSSTTRRRGKKLRSPNHAGYGFAGHLSRVEAKKDGDRGARFCISTARR